MKDLSLILNQLKDLNSDRDRALGRLEALNSELESFGCEDFKEAEELAKSLENEVTELRQTLSEQIDDLALTVEAIQEDINESEAS